MSFKLNNRFKSISGLVLAIGWLFAVPSFASQDSVVVDTTKATEAVATNATAAGANVVDSATTAKAEVAASAGTSTTKVDAKAAEVEKKIDPQVYKNFIYYVLLFLVICTVVAVIGKVISIYELTNKMNRKHNPLASNSFQAWLLFIFLFVFLGGVYYSFSHYGGMSWRDAVTEHGTKIDTMFIITTVITTFVLIITHILLLTFTFIYRMKKNGKAYYLPHNNTIEKIWTIVPAFVLTVLVLFGFFTWRSITNVPEDLQKSALQIEVLGEQFAWHVRYPGLDGQIGKRNYKLTTPTNPYGIDFNDKTSWDDIQGADIVIPVNKSVRFHIISKILFTHSTFLISAFRSMLYRV
jgi:cytochrome c oxidase subunit 2